MNRSHNCGALRAPAIGQKVTLCGWVNRRRDHGGLIFIDLRDRFGITQLVFDPKLSSASHKIASSLRSEWVLSVSGKVRHRGEGLVNSKLPTGEIEIEAESIEILSKSKTPPFSICDEEIDTHEEIRLKHRYLDIRRGKIAQNLLTRHKAMLSIRNFLNSQDFLEINTPILGKATPEGARDYLVPSRIYPGNFYALPQSPQIFKQLLMISGMDRYFQIAPCFRDEDLRSDRQPEFTQLDMEMSFSSPKELFSIVETLMKTLFKEVLHVEITTPFPHITHKEAIEKYGTDKPDLRFKMPLIRIDDICKKSEFSLLKEELASGGCVKALCVPNGGYYSRKQIDSCKDLVEKFGLKGLAWMKCSEEGLNSSVTKFFTLEQLLEIQKRVDVSIGDLLLIGAGPDDRVNQALDHLRRHIARQEGWINPNEYHFSWVTDFPLFSLHPETKKIQAEHHPFTSPHPDDLSLLQNNPLKVRALAYDLVINGYEVASGSQRIHKTSVQQQIFSFLKLSPQELQEKFGFFLEALEYGTPPHLGIALGLDRICMILSQTDNIREVIAFPKTQKAADLMMQSPSAVEENQLKELKISTNPAPIFW